MIKWITWSWWFTRTNSLQGMVLFIPSKVFDVSIMFSYLRAAHPISRKAPYLYWQWHYPRIQAYVENMQSGLLDKSSHACNELYVPLCRLWNPKTCILTVPWWERRCMAAEQSRDKLERRPLLFPAINRLTWVAFHQNIRLHCSYAADIPPPRRRHGDLSIHINGDNFRRCRYKIANRPKHGDL
jgi:hypothetical protein